MNGVSFAEFFATTISSAASIAESLALTQYGKKFINKIFFPEKEQIPIKSTEDCLNIIRSNADLKAFKKNWKELAFDPLRKEESKKIDALYTQLMKNHSPSLINIKGRHFFADLDLSSGLSSLWMPGIALIATHLVEKKKIKGLYVCADRSVLIRKVEEIITSPNDERCALILGSDGGGDDIPLHKMTFGIEKKEGRLKIILFDSLGQNVCSTPSLLSVLKVCKDKGVLPELFFSGLKREFAGYGCAVFALQDAVSFLQQENFFQDIDFEYTQFYGEFKAHIINTLPPEFMIGMQSLRGLENYKALKNGDLFEAPILGRKKNLKEYLEQNQITSHQKRENHYITKKLFQYKKFIVAALQELSDEELRNLVYKTLLI